MRNAQLILQTVGDDPLFELMELDETYGWTRRIHTLRSIFEPKRSHWPAVVIGIGVVLGISLIAVAVYVAVTYS